MNDTATIDTTETAKEKRARQLREAKQRQRERERERGWAKIEVRLTAEEADLLVKAVAMYSGAPEEFYARALTTGAKFLANAGNVRGGKVRLK